MTRTCQHCGAPIDPARIATAAYCKPKTACGLDRRREWKRKRVAAKRTACARCGDALPPATGKKPRTFCPRGTGCSRARMREWKASHPESMRQQRLRGAERQKEWRRKRRLDPRYRAQERDAENKRLRDPGYKDAQRRRGNEWKMKRYRSDPDYRERCIENSNRTHPLIKHRSTLIEQQHGHCGICGDPLTGEIHIDHVIPRALGGPDTLDNLQAAHAVCNLRKGATL